mmetsp:Transcript_36683/g.110138  ORF Transcript_36683/g.110138 Transcript_36683/m.110138 type:complete len:248 (-) Transcript_36683:60-803(-)
MVPSRDQRRPRDPPGLRGNPRGAQGAQCGLPQLRWHLQAHGRLDPPQPRPLLRHVRRLRSVVRPPLHLSRHAVRVREHHLLLPPLRLWRLGIHRDERHVRPIRAVLLLLHHGGRRPDGARFHVRTRFGDARRLPPVVRRGPHGGDAQPRTRVRSSTPRRHAVLLGPPQERGESLPGRDGGRPNPDHHTSQPLHRRSVRSGVRSHPIVHRGRDEGQKQRVHRAEGRPGFRLDGPLFHHPPQRGQRVLV